MEDTRALDEPTPDRLVFIGGLHRSGTTLLADLVDEHPDISSLRGTGVPHDEGQHLQTSVANASELGGPGRFALADRAHLVETDVERADDTRRALLAAWTPFWDTSRRLLVEKSPPNLLRFRYLEAVFPGAACIAIVRHPVAVAYATQPWVEASIAELIEHWLRAHEQFAADRSHLERVCVLRYEDLARDVAGTLARLDAFLGVVPHDVAHVVRTGTNDRYLARWRHTRLVPARFRIETTARRFEDRLSALGYGYSIRDRQ
jgi:Sulfotransferase family